MIVTSPVIATDKPADDLVGRWGGLSGTSTCVVVARDAVLCARHQKGDVGSLAAVGGAEYRVERLEIHETLDLQLARLVTMDYRPARLAAAARVDPRLAVPSVPAVPQGIILAGWGVTSRSISFDYAWDGPRRLSWGEADLVGVYRASGIAVCQGPSYLAPGDSGGPWFRRDEKLGHLVFAVSVSTGSDGKAVYGDVGFGQLIDAPWVSRTLNRWRRTSKIQTPLVPTQATAKTTATAVKSRKVKP